MKTHIIAFFITYVLAISCFAEEKKLVLLSPQKSEIANDDVVNISKQKSIKRDDGGYLENDLIVGCFAAMSYRYTGGRYVDKEIRFRLRSPEKIEPGKKYPILIWLHGMGESGDDNRRQLAHMQSTLEFLAGEKQIDFYLLATQCPSDNTSWENSLSNYVKGDAPLTIMKEILDILLEERPVDRNRISLYGQCSGARGAWEFLRKYPELVAAMAVFSTTPPTDFTWKKSYCKTSFWAFNNLDDYDVPVEPMRKYVKNINDSGGLGYVTIRKYGGHDTWSLGMKKDKVIAWLVLQNRDNFAPPPGVVVKPKVNVTRGVFLCILPLLLSLVLILRKIRCYDLSVKKGR